MWLWWILHGLSRRLRFSMAFLFWLGLFIPECIGRRFTARLFSVTSFLCTLFDIPRWFWGAQFPVLRYTFVHFAPTPPHVGFYVGQLISVAMPCNWWRIHCTNADQRKHDYLHVEFVGFAGWWDCGYNLWFVIWSWGFPRETIHVRVIFPVVFPQQPHKNRRLLPRDHEVSLCIN